MLTDSVSEIAKALDQAERTRVQIPSLLEANPSITIQDAYDIQAGWIDLKLARGAVMRGRKVGLTSKAMINASTVDEPDYGILLDDMIYEDGARIPSERYITPLIECELAFVLAKPLSGPDVTIFDVLAATDFVVPALELVDLRIPRIDPVTQKPRTISFASHDLGNFGATLRVMGNFQSEG